MEVGLYITHDGTTYAPPVLDGISWTTERKGSPSSLKFSILDDDVEFSEGDLVQLYVDGTGTFYGWIFAQKRSKSGEVSITAYDQLRYLKNKDNYVYENKKASEFIQMVANDFYLQCGQIDTTSFNIVSRVETNTTLFDMIQNALDLELTNARELYVLYDDFGKLTLRNIANMQVGILLTEEAAQDYNYSTSIDKDTYNKVKLGRDNSTTGMIDTYIAQSGESIQRWGVLQYYEKLSGDTDGTEANRANVLLELYNQPSRTLTISDAFGDVRCRAGALVAVQMDLTGETLLDNWMLIEKAQHSFKNGEHTMSLTLRGGIINNG